MTDYDSELNKLRTTRVQYKIHKIEDSYFIALDPTLIDNIADSFTEEIASEGILLRRAKKEH